MMCDARLFTPQIAAFSAERPILTFPLTGANTIEALAEGILQNAPPTFALLGLSMGGIVAMEVIRQAPDRVSRLALLDTNPLAETAEKRAARRPQIDTVRSGGLRDVMRDEMKPNYLVDGPHRSRILDLCMEMAETLGPGAFVSQSQALASRPDQQRMLKSVSIPTLVLCGKHDIPCPIERHELMHDLIPNSDLAIIEGAGHLPVAEQPESTNKEIRKWLN